MSHKTHWEGVQEMLNKNIEERKGNLELKVTTTIDLDKCNWQESARNEIKVKDNLGTLRSCYDCGTEKKVFCGYYKPLVQENYK